ncbi:MAG: transcription antitermination factor NusB [Candidatus Bipolaricaulis anaerobius]|nr:transcription antitermination factor NusB [Candidatus Bipolaricaulis anaerobius]MDD5764070.1 transcription antitermination factor NusB [Candidatus Bipolaricaulis anaerobius]
MRRQAREAVLRSLYRDEYLPLSADDPLGDEDLAEEAFARALLAGVHEQRAEIDRIIDQRALGWGLDRLPVVDRNILRLALYELLYTATPPEVVINEAVELAKTYGTEHAPAVINGILDRVWKERHGDAQVG